MKSALSALLFSAAALATPAWAASDVVTVYSADGLHDGKGSWFETQFDAFTKATGVKVRYVEGGSGGVVERVAKEKSNPQADVLVTCPHSSSAPRPRACYRNSSRKRRRKSRAAAIPILRSFSITSASSTIRPR
jgi:hypothetical protein